MSQIRKHYYLDEYCIIAPGRGFRPTDFKKAEPDADTVNCVFCGGNEDKTPPATAVYTPEGVRTDEQGVVKNWQVRCVPNLYPALSPIGREDLLGSGFGYHEVIIETPWHNHEPSGFSDREIVRLLEVYRDRYAYYVNQENVKFVSLFKNHGRPAGASIVHTHTQLIALPLVPPGIRREVGGGDCPFCSTVISRELSSERLILEEGEWVAFAPYYSKHPFEVWIAPMTHLSSLGDVTGVRDLAFALRGVLASLHKLFGTIDYNYMFYQHTDRNYHFHIKLFPRLSITAGFEENTGIYINTVAPEDAAEQLREGIVG